MRIELAGFNIFTGGTGITFDLTTSGYKPLSSAFAEGWNELVYSPTNPIGTSTVAELKPFDTDHDGSWDSNLKGSFVIEKAGTVTVWNGNYTGDLTHTIKVDQSIITMIEPWVTAGLNSFVRVYWDGGATVSGVVGKTLAELTVDGTEIDGTVGADIITTTAAAETIKLGFGDDILNAGAGDDNALGDVGNDTLNGEIGNDTLDGGVGSDNLNGGAGNDLLFGGSNDDQMTGGAGEDTFQFTATSQIGRKTGLRDIITDFEVGVDVIDLQEIDAHVRKNADTFKFIGEKDFTKKGGQINIEHVGEGSSAVTLISGETNGNKKADFVIELSGHHDLTAVDFFP